MIETRKNQGDTIDKESIKTISARIEIKCLTISTTIYVLTNVSVSQGIATIYRHSIKRKKWLSIP